MTAPWIVAANLSEIQPDKLRRLETWLINAAPAVDRPRVAVLIDFVPVSGGAFGFPFEPGEAIEGEVVFYPSAAPLRGLLASRKPSAGAPPPWPAPPSPAGVRHALAEYAERLAALPWLDAWPLLLHGVSIRMAGKGALAIAGDDGMALPLERGQTDALMPMVGLEGLQVLCSWDGRAARLVAAETPIGRWYEA